MPLDGITLSGIIHELKDTVLDGRVDKIAQPEEDEIVLSIRGRGVNYKLLLTANASAPRLHLTNHNKQNPLQAPMICMVLRKHLSGGRLVNIIQPDFERIAELHIESRDEMGDKTLKKLLIEIMGKHSNIILTDEKGIILDAVKHISYNTSSVREVLPGKIYYRPPSHAKANPLAADSESFVRQLSLDDKKGQKIQQALYQSYNGISPAAASEICRLAAVPPDAYTGSLPGESLAALFTSFSGVFDRVRNGDYSFIIYYGDKLSDYSAFPFGIYVQLNSKVFDSPSLMLETFYLNRDTEYRLSQKMADLKKLVNNHMERCVKKQILYEKTKEDIKDRDHLKIRGELITSYIYLIEKGAESFSAPNFYDGNKPLDIKLDKGLSPAENAQNYFKQYNKQKRTAAALQEQLKQNRDELNYLESVSAALETASGEEDIAEIRAELAGQGFVKRRTGRTGNPVRERNKSKPLVFTSSEGFLIYVGKNNTQNDELTLRFALNSDIWLHTKDIAGSHVLIRAEGKQVPEKTILEAAHYAALYSRAKDGSQVPVDYTFRRHVRKPNGAKPGYVIYEHNKTVYVTPRVKSEEV